LNQSEELRIHVSDSLLGRRVEAGDATRDERCGSSKFGPLQVNLGICSGGTDFMLNRADFMTLGNWLALFEFELNVLNAYRLNPSLLPDFTGRFPVSREAFLRQLTVGEYGRLRSQNRLAQGRELAQDMLLASQHFLISRDQYCQKGYPTSENRPGYLFSEGFCGNPQKESGQSSEEKQVALVESILTGQVFTSEHLEQVRGSNLRSTPRWAIRPFKFLQSPLEDLESLLPAEFDACEDLVRLNDRPLQTYMSEGTSGDFLRSILGPACELPQKPQKNEESRQSGEQR